MKRHPLPDHSPRRDARSRDRRPSRRHTFAPTLVRLEDRRLLTSAVFADSFGAGPTNSVSVEAEAVDATGSTYLTGNFSGTVSFGARTLTSPSLRNIFVAKLDASGAVVWAVGMGSSSTSGDFGRALALDPAGNLVVTGFYSGSGDFGGVTLTDSGQQDVFVEKLDKATGAVLWAKGFGGVGLDLGQSVAVDPNGNVYVTGSYQDTASFGAGGQLTAPDASSTDIFVTKLNSSGTVLWAKSLGGAGQNSGFGIAVDASSNVYVTGNYTGSGPFGNVLLVSAGDSDVFVARLDSAGNVVWAISQGGPGHDDSTAVAVDSAGNVYTTGDFVGTASFGALTLTSAGQDDAFVERLDAAGHVVWAKGFGGAGFDAGFGLTVDGAGNVYSTGVFQGQANFGGVPLTSNGDYDTYFLKLNPAGATLNALDLGSTAGDQAYQVAVGGPNADVTLVGSYGAQFNVLNYGLPAAASGYVVRLNLSSPAAAESVSNFDGVGYSQIAVWRPSTSQWFALVSTGGHLVGTFGGPTDVPVAGDYDSLGHAEMAVYRPSTGQWFAKGPGGGHLVGVFGTSTDVPVPGDYDGTGHSELAYFRPSTSQWFVQGLSGSRLVGTLGASTDVPVPGDYFGVGHTEIAVFRPSTGQWFVAGPNGNVLFATFGGRGDVPVPGNLEGTGATEAAVFRPSTSQWFVHGQSGNHLLNVFGSPKLIDIPTEATAGALAQLGYHPGGGGGFSVHGESIGGGSNGFALVAGPGGGAAPGVGHATAAPTPSPASFRSSGSGGRSAFVVKQGSTATKVKADAAGRRSGRLPSR